MVKPMPGGQAGSPAGELADKLSGPRGAETAAAGRRRGNGAARQRRKLTEVTKFA